MIYTIYHPDHLRSDIIIAPIHGLTGIDRVADHVFLALVARHGRDEVSEEESDDDVHAAHERGSENLEDDLRHAVDYIEKNKIKYGRIYEMCVVRERAAGLVSKVLRQLGDMNPTV